MRETTTRSRAEGTERGEPFRVGIVGATGNTGVELAADLVRHPDLDLVFGTSRDRAGQRLDAVDPVAPPIGLVHPEDAESERVDLVFLCLPHGASAPEAERWFERGTPLIDLSGDLRLRDEDTHARIYGTDRSERLMEATVYGLPELEREAIRSTRVVSNPGCYATAVELALLPLAEAGLLGDGAYVDAKSGVSGAGRKATATTHFCSANEDVRPYKVGRLHRHVPEMEQVLAGAAPSGSGPVVFVPHLVPLERGILATCAVRGTGLSEEQARSLYTERYAGEPLVSFPPPGEQARIRSAARTDRAVISTAGVEGLDLVVIACAIDNLGKGAAGQAVQNMNLMLGLSEGRGLRG